MLCLYYSVNKETKGAKSNVKTINIELNCNLGT